MRKPYRHCKCACFPRDPDRWRIIREYPSVCVLFCDRCENAWYSSGTLVNEFPKEIVSEYRWRQIKTLPGFHAREDEEIME